MSIPDTKLHTSSTVQLETSSWILGLSDSALLGMLAPVGLPVEGALILGLFSGAAEERSRGDEVSCLFAFFRRP